MRIWYNFTRNIHGGSIMSLENLYRTAIRRRRRANRKTGQKKMRQTTETRCEAKTIPKKDFNLDGDVPFARKSERLEREEEELLSRFFGTETVKTPLLIEAEEEKKRIAHLNAGVEEKLRQGNEDICPPD